jgi:hypothetical protein
MRQWRRRKKYLGVFSIDAKRCKSVNISENNNTNKNFFSILANYTIWDALSQKTISRYCPFKVETKNLRFHICAKIIFAFLHNFACKNKRNDENFHEHRGKKFRENLKCFTLITERQNMSATCETKGDQFCENILSDMSFWQNFAAIFACTEIFAQIFGFVKIFFLFEKLFAKIFKRQKQMHAATLQIFLHKL